MKTETNVMSSDAINNSCLTLRNFYRTEKHVDTSSKERPDVEKPDVFALS